MAVPVKTRATCLCVLWTLLWVAVLASDLAVNAECLSSLPPTGAVFSFVFICVCVCLFVSFFVCLFVGSLTRKVMNGFWWNSVEIHVGNGHGNSWLKFDCDPDPDLGFSKDYRPGITLIQLTIFLCVCVKFFLRGGCEISNNWLDFDYDWIPILGCLFRMPDMLGTV